MNDNDEKAPLTPEEAVAMLPDDEYVHTFRSGPGLLVGADIKRERLVELIHQHGAELAGPGATSMGHGLALTDGSGPLFIKTREETKAG